MNGSNLTLIATGALAVVASLAGRMGGRNMSAHRLRANLEALFEQSSEESEVDSGDLLICLGFAQDADGVPAFLREQVEDLLAQSDEEQYLDTGDALDLLRQIYDALPE